MCDSIIITGTDSVLEVAFNDPIVLDPNKTHWVGLVDFVAFNSIPNINETNQKFYYGKGKSATVPRGSYEIEAIAAFLKSEIGEDKIELRPNNNTLQSEIKSAYEIDFRPVDSLGSLLGFGPVVLEAGKWHRSDRGVNVMSVNMICVECSIASGTYVNDSRSHTIFAFAPNVPPGYKMAVSPKNMVFSRINTNRIDRIRINIVDQDGRQVDFAGETVTIRLQFKTSNG